MKIALVTPWPPQQTGIADYAYDLAYGLLQANQEVTVITSEIDPRPLPGIQFCLPETITDEIMRPFDDIVYQMGNNSTFHVYIIELLFRYSGTVHLHDMVLHHITAWILYLNDINMYKTVLKKWYGPYALDLFYKLIKEKRPLIWDTEFVTDIPLFEEVIQHAQRCIVHSNFAYQRIKDVFPHLPCKVIPQLYRPESIKSYVFSDSSFHIGIFGGVGYNKRVELILECAAEAVRRGANLSIHIAGAIYADGKHIYDLIDKLSLKSVVTLHGRIDHNQFLSILSSIDLCIALRYPSMGETSAIAMRALQLGVPLIVNDIGWYSELPSFVPKIVPHATGESEALSSLIANYAAGSDEYKIHKQQVLNYAKNELNFL
jgi:glycosyltransferase involved in cell wall biosynthesis